MAAKDVKLTVLEGFEAFTIPVSKLDHNGVKGVTLSDGKGNEIVILLAPITTENKLSGTGKSYTRASTGGFGYFDDGLGVSMNINENVKKPRVRVVVVDAT